MVFFNVYLSYFQALQTECVDRLTTLNQQEASQQEKLTCKVQSEQQTLDANCTEICKWAETTTQALETRDQELVTFLNEHLKKDVPTGNSSNITTYSWPQIDYKVNI